VEQLIFVGIIILFSVLEAVARKGRAAQGGGEGVPLPEEPEARRPRPRPRPPSEPRTGSVPHSYDEDPSFDDAARGDEGRLRPEAAAARAAPIGEESAPARTSSEGLIPAEVWEEIQGLARGERPETQKAPASPAPPPMPTPTPTPSRPSESRPAGWPRPSTTRSRPSGKATPSPRAGAPTSQARTGKDIGRAPSRSVAGAPAQEGTADHPVHLAHQAFGTAPSTRAGVPPAGGARSASPAAQAVRSLLASRGSLRQAVILQELLGPPPGLRDG
jgi:hypothetical protein